VRRGADSKDALIETQFGSLAYLQRTSSHFSINSDSLASINLWGTFEVSKSEVHSVVWKLFIDRDEKPCSDQPIETIVIRNIMAFHGSALFRKRRLIT
jgi:hypothetical protein